MACTDALAHEVIPDIASGVGTVLDQQRLRPDPRDPETFELSDEVLLVPRHLGIVTDLLSSVKDDDEVLEPALVEISLKGFENGRPQAASSLGGLNFTSPAMAKG